MFKPAAQFDSRSAGEGFLDWTSLFPGPFLFLQLCMTQLQRTRLFLRHTGPGAETSELLLGVWLCLM